MEKFETMQQLLSYTRRAVDDYNMIEEGDKIAVGVSGGKDSLTLLCALKGLRRFYPKKFEIVPLAIDMGFDGCDYTTVHELCARLDLKLEIVKTEIKTVVFDIRKESAPCSLCANMRRGALNESAKKLGCNKVALGHHFDDVVETLVMNLFNEGRIGCFSPVTYLDRIDITVLRPFIYVPEKFVTSFVRRNNITPLPKLCQEDGNTDREYYKQMISTLEQRDKGVKMRIFGALERAGVNGFTTHERARRTKSN